MFAPVAVRVALPPEQTFTVLTLIDGRGLTLSSTVWVEVHPEEVPVTL